MLYMPLSTNGSAQADMASGTRVLYTLSPEYFLCTNSLEACSSGLCVQGQAASNSQQGCPGGLGPCRCSLRLRAYEAAGGGGCGTHRLVLLVFEDLRPALVPLLRRLGRAPRESGLRELRAPPALWRQLPPPTYAHVCNRTTRHGVHDKRCPDGSACATLQPNGPRALSRRTPVELQRDKTTPGVGGRCRRTAVALVAAKRLAAC